MESKYGICLTSSISLSIEFFKDNIEGFLFKNSTKKKQYIKKINRFIKKIENLVFIKLIQDGNKVYYWQDDKRKEIDFIVPDKKNFHKYQVSYNLTPENSVRELSSFVLTSKYIFGNNYLLTLDENEEDFVYKLVNIKKVNIIKRLLWISFESIENSAILYSNK